jgi:hypothetical protein
MLKKYFVAYQILKHGEQPIYGSAVLPDHDDVEPDVFFSKVAREIAKKHMVLLEGVIITAFNRVN